MTIGDHQYSFEGALVAFLGDTHAVNNMEGGGGGFKEGVRRAMCKCHHCMATNYQIQTKVRFEILRYLKCRCYNILYINMQFVEEEFSLRTKQGHIEQ